jgi:signal transduction histidine kinase
VLSKENISDVNRFATFSYLFVIIIISFLFITLFFNKNIKLINFNISYSSRLQLTIIGILLFAFFIIGGISSYYIRSLNNDKNQEKAKDISGSLKIEFENKISKADFPGMDSVDYLKELSIKFSKVFDTDINLYDRNGNLITSTRPRVFDYNLMSKKINPTAISAIKSDALPYFMNVENIGSMEFMSAYRPITKNGELVAFINLPYFAKQSQQRKEITSFILTLLNVYTLIIIISLIIAIIVSSYITRPLQTLKNKMKAVNLGKTNEYIKWNKDDEIGQLIQEYNKMLKELENSAELLAQSERASAWKEMAKQVAHEIKNPLTPMRLHIQHVQKLVGTEGFEDKFKSMASNLIQQIDALAEIATAFSDFAKMPRFDKQKIELGQIIRSAAELNQSDSVDINLNFNTANEYYILSDQKQMLRVFNNLMNNSIQASKDNENQKIEIDLNEDKNNYFIKFKDYGVGISEDKKDKIFVPNFTTKSHGMGMGLAIVKSIIISSGGNISFESEADKGTSFFIELPKYK